MIFYKRFRSKFSLLVLLVAISGCSFQQNNFPGKYWVKVENPAGFDFSLSKLEEAKKYSTTINTAAVVIIVEGKVLYEWGEVSKKYMTHSLRKSVLSAMYGNYVEQGIIDLDVTMADLGINDEPPLSEDELKATIRDCIKARSGVYHPALYESAGMKARKPARYSEKAGAHWYYNNWDFNVAGAIFKEKTGKDIFEDIENEIATPIQMESFIANDGWYVTGDIASIDSDGFIYITDRLSRFSKIGGEMVPHIKIEEEIHNICEATEPVCAVTAVPDEKKGERLVVLCDRAMDVDLVRNKLSERNMPNLWIPKKEYFIPVDEIPQLGTGKKDLAKIKLIAKEYFKDEE